MLLVLCTMPWIDTLLVAQRPAWNCLFSRPNRNYPTIWTYGSPDVLIHGRVHIFRFWGPAANYCRCNWCAILAAFAVPTSCPLIYTNRYPGPITVFSKTIYGVIEKQPNPPNYLWFVGWVYLWAAIFHWITAVLNCECGGIN